MKNCFLLMLLTIIISSVSIAQKTKNSPKCNCKYPYKPECSDYCLRKLLQNKNFKQTVDRRRLSDTGRIKLENWMKDSINNQSIKSVLDKKDLTKIDALLEAYYDNPDNIIRSSSPFIYGLGGTISVLFGKVYTPSFNPNSPPTSSSFALQQTSFTFFPRYNLTQSENSSISVGAPVGVGIGITQNSFTNDVGVLLAYDLPVVIDYNFGCMATRKSLKRFGGYVGMGFGYYNVSISKSAYSDFSGATYGPMGRLGMRFGKETWIEKAVTIGIFYKKGLETSKLNTAGFNVLYDF